MYMFPGSPIAIFTGLYAALSSAVAHLVTRRRWTAALLTGFLVSLLPQIESRLQQQPLYHRLMMYWFRSMSRVYTLLHPRERAEVERHREEMIEQLGIDPETGIPPELVTIERVIPVGQTQRLEDATLMMLSIESYAEGFLIHGRLLLDRAPEEPPFFDPGLEHSFPRITRLEVRDDRGHWYQAMSGGGGGGRAFRYEFHAGQPLDAQARELVLEIPEIRWHTFSSARGEHRDDRVVTGPWRFTAAL